MAKFVLTDVKTTINGVNFSDHIASITWDVSSDEIDTTAFGGSGFRTRVGGLKDGSVSISFHEDFASSSVNATISALLGSYATVVSTPTSSAVSATNPSYTGVFLVSQAAPGFGAVGDLATIDYTWPSAGTAGIVRGTA